MAGAMNSFRREHIAFISTTIVASPWESDGISQVLLKNTDFLKKGRRTCLSEHEQSSDYLDNSDEQSPEAAQFRLSEDSATSS